MTIFFSPYFHHLILSHIRQQVHTVRLSGLWGSQSFGSHWAVKTKSLQPARGSRWSVPRCNSSKFWYCFCWKPHWNPSWTSTADCVYLSSPWGFFFLHLLQLLGRCNTTVETSTQNKNSKGHPQTMSCTPALKLWQAKDVWLMCPTSHSSLNSRRNINTNICFCMNITKLSSCVLLKWKCKRT